MAADGIILFPVTNETYATGSLAETGFSILNAIKVNNRRDFIIMIDKDLKQELKDQNPAMAKDSMRARALVLAHLSKLDIDGLYIVDSFDKMLELSIGLWESLNIRNKIVSKGLHTNVK